MKDLFRCKISPRSSDVFLATADIRYRKCGILLFKEKDGSLPVGKDRDEADQIETEAYIDYECCTYKHKE